MGYVLSYRYEYCDDHEKFHKSRISAPLPRMPEAPGAGIPIQAVRYMLNSDKEKFHALLHVVLFFKGIFRFFL